MHSFQQHNKTALWSSLRWQELVQWPKCAKSSTCQLNGTHILDDLYSVAVCLQSAWTNTMFLMHPKTTLTHIYKDYITHGNFNFASRQLPSTYSITYFETFKVIIICCCLFRFSKHWNMTYFPIHVNWNLYWVYTNAWWIIPKRQAFVLLWCHVKRKSYKPLYCHTCKHLR